MLFIRADFYMQKEDTGPIQGEHESLVFIAVEMVRFPKAF